MKENISFKDICNGLVKNEFEFFYQPIISLVTGQICNAEALLRWKQNDGSIILPASFIPFAEEKGFITEITQAMYPVLIDDIASMPEIDPSFFITLNLTTADLESENLAENIGNSLSKKGVSPARLGFEIVESVFMPPNPRVRKSISAFDEQGISIILNDFSAGNTTLNFLSQLPLTALKLSMDIVQRALKTIWDFRIFRHLVSMAHQLNLTVIAEGVENPEIYDLILSTGCTAAQGYYFSKPLPKSEFIKLLDKQTHWGRHPFGIEYLAQIDEIDLCRDFIREALIIYFSSDDSVKERALTRLPMIMEIDDLLNSWNFGIDHSKINLSDIKSFRQTHQQYLETGKNLITMAVNHDSWELLKQIIKKFSAQSSELQRILQKLATEKLVKHYEPLKEKL